MLLIFEWQEVVDLMVDHQWKESEWTLALWSNQMLLAGYMVLEVACGFGNYTLEKHN